MRLKSLNKCVFADCIISQSPGLSSDNMLRIYVNGENDILPFAVKFIILAMYYNILISHMLPVCYQ